MFTLRFERHNSSDYDVYECQRYSVSENSDPEDPNAINVTEATKRYRSVQMFRTLADDNPYYEQVGETQPYGVAYVTNDAGKTVDRIR